MIFVPILFLLKMPFLAIHAFLAVLTTALPQSFYDALDNFFSVIQQMNGAIPVMISLVQGLLVLFYAFLASLLWRVLESLFSYAPDWLIGKGHMPAGYDLDTPQGKVLDLRRRKRGKRY